MFYPSFAFKCSVIQQRYGDSSRSMCSLDFKLTGIQIATKLMPGTPNGEHRNYELQFLLSGMMPVSQNLIYNLQKGLSDVFQSIRFSTAVLYTYRAGVRKRRCGEAAGGFLLQYRPLIA